MPLRAMLRIAIVAAAMFAAATAGFAQAPARRGSCPAVSVAKGPAVDGTGKDPLWVKCPDTGQMV